MDTPVFQQLSGLAGFIRSALRADSYLVTGEADTDLGYTADQVCKGVVTHKMFEVQGEDISMYVELGKLNFPALAVYVDNPEFAPMDGGMGLDCSIGIQYIFESNIRDITTQAFASHLSMAIWWAICESCMADMQSTDGTLRNTYHIDNLGFEGMKLLPPLSERVRAFEASGSMTFRRPLWDRGADSHQVVDLGSIYADYNETSDVGDTPLVQSIFQPS